MLLSFIVPAFNNPKRLRTCLSSLLDQTIPDSEIEIIVCDNSTDDSEASDNDFLCAQMGSRIRYEYTADRTIIGGPHLRCLYTATEIGAGLAKGEWLAFPNQDTAYPPVFAERMIGYAEINNFDLVLCDFILGGPELNYHPRTATPHVCNCDKTAFIVRRSCFSGFHQKSTNYSCADGHFVQSLAESGIRHGKLAEYLVTHN